MSKSVVLTDLTADADAPAAADLAAFDALVDALRPRTELPSAPAVLAALRNAELRTAFIEREGVLTAPQVAQVAGSRARNASAVASRWRLAGRIFAVAWGDQLLYPVFQFSNGAPRPAVARVLAAMGPDVSSWQVALWFATPSPHLEGGARPMDLLDGPSSADRLAGAAVLDATLPDF